MIDSKKHPINLTKQKEQEQILPQAPVLSSHQAGWESIGVFYYSHPAHSIPEHCLTHHILAIAHNPFQLEVRTNGKFKSNCNPHLKVWACQKKDAFFLRTTCLEKHFF